MEKLTVMKYNRMIMAILGINPYSFESRPLNWIRTVNPFLMTISLIISDVLATMYANQETHLPLMLEAFVLVIGGTASFFAYLNMIWQTDSVGEVNLKLQEIADQGIQNIFILDPRTTIRSNLAFFAIDLQLLQRKHWHPFISMLNKNVVILLNK